MEIILSVMMSLPAVTGTPRHKRIRNPRDPEFWRRPGLELRTTSNSLKFITRRTAEYRERRQRERRERRHHEEEQCWGENDFDDAQLAQHHLCGPKTVPVKIRLPKGRQHDKERVMWQNPTVAMVTRCKGVCQTYSHMKCSPRGRKEKIRVKTRIRWDHKNETDCYEIPISSHNQCYCRCTLTTLHCEKFGVDFSLDPNTCSCKCQLTRDDCLHRSFRNLDKNTCTCRDKMDDDNYYDDEI